MAIRFVCPSCKVLIEIEDDWAGESVACGNCRSIVTAPAQTTWSPEELRTARPAGPGAEPTVFQAPPPPPYATGPHAADYGRSLAGGSSSAFWGFLLAIGAAVAGTLAVGLFSFMAMSMAYDNLGEKATPDQIQQEAARLMKENKVPQSPLVTALSLMSVLGSGAGIFLAIRSLLRGEPRRVLAIVTILLGALFFVCQLPLSLGMAASSNGGG